MNRYLPIAAGAGVAAIIAALSLAAAQPEVAAKPAAEPSQAGPITPRKPRARALESAPVERKSAGEVDWSEVNAAVSQAAEGDAAVERQVRAMELSRAVPTEERVRLRRSGLRASSPREYKSVASKEVAETRVPVLVPMYSEAQGDMKVAARENSYTAFCNLPGGAYFEMIGTRMRLIGEGPDRLRARALQGATRTMESLGPAPYTVSRHEQGIELSFSRFNVAYQIAVYCRDPLTDIRCSGEDYIVSLAENLAVLNAERGAGQ